MFCASFHPIKHHLAVESGWNGSPIGVARRLIVDVHHIDLLHLPPFVALSVQLGDAVGRQVGYLNAYAIHARLQQIGELQGERCGPSAAY